MPALFAYLIAIGLLLGGGYGTLSWLAAPEPVKVALKAKSRPRPAFEAGSQARSSPADDGNRVAVRSDPTAAQSDDRADQSETGAAADHPAALPQPSMAPQDQQGRSAHAEASPADANANPEVAAGEAGHQSGQEPAMKPAPAASPEHAAVVAATAKTMKRQHQQQAGSRSDRPKLALMILRTIEYPDGRRVSQLLPYRGGALAPGE